jgi:hypothetical protein
VPNVDCFVSVGLKWTNRKIGKIVTLYQRNLFKNIPRLYILYPVSKTRVKDYQTTLKQVYRGLNPDEWWWWQQNDDGDSSVSKIHVLWDGTLYQPANRFWTLNGSNVVVFSQTVLKCLPIYTVSSTVTYAIRCSQKIRQHKQVSWSSRTNGTTITCSCKNGGLSPYRRASYKGPTGWRCAETSQVPDVTTNCITYIMRMDGTHTHAYAHTHTHTHTPYRTL